MANPVGRPRTSSPSPQERIKIGEELIRWVKEENENNPHLLFSEFYSLHMHILRKDWKLIIEREEFKPYYEQAQAVLAKRCMDGTMEKSFGQRFIRLYSRELTEEENETAKYNSDLRKAEIQSDKESSFEKFVEIIENKRKNDPISKAH